MKHRKTIFWGLITICIALYIASCFLPCYSTKNECTRGYFCLLAGWSNIIADLWLFLIWCSNIAYITIIVKILRNNDVQIIIPAISFLLSTSMLFHKYITYDIVVPITKFHIGYYFWVTSYLSLLGICILKKSCALSSELSGRQYD